MKSSILFAFLGTIALAMILVPQQLHATTTSYKEEDHYSRELPFKVIGGRTGRFLPYKPPRGGALITCDNYPRVCRAKGSSGPDCCYKKCVDVKTDELNCGRCGRRCKYFERCCQGVCVNPYINEKHCGRCDHNCKKGSSCVYGLCSYA